MQRIAFARAVRSSLTTTRAISTTPRFMAEGSTGSGASRMGGERGGDSFTRRERSAEEMYIRNEEREKLRQLKEKFQAEKKHIEEMEKHIDEQLKEQGGEQN